MEGSRQESQHREIFLSYWAYDGSLGKCRHIEEATTVLNWQLGGTMHPSQILEAAPCAQTHRLLFLSQQHSLEHIQNSKWDKDPQAHLPLPHHTAGTQRSVLSPSLLPVSLPISGLITLCSLLGSSWPSCLYLCVSCQYPSTVMFQSRPVSKKSGGMRGRDDLNTGWRGIERKKHIELF